MDGFVIWRTAKPPPPGVVGSTRDHQGGIDGQGTCERRCRQAKGAVKEAAGKVTGDKGLEAEGKVDKAKGDMHKAAGDVKDAVKDATKP